MLLEAVTFGDASSTIYDIFLHIYFGHFSNDYLYLFIGLKARTTVTISVGFHCCQVLL